MAQQIKVNSATGNIQIQISRGAIGPSTTANVANTAYNLDAASTANVKIGGGVANYVLQTDGAGNTSWVAQTGGGATNPAGANTQVQFNDQGSFGAESNFTYDKATDVLTVDHFSGEAGNLSNIQLANVTGAGNIASINLDGNVANVLAGDGTFIAAGGGGTPGGSNTQVQYNDNGSFGGEAVFTYDEVTDTLTAPNITATTQFEGDINGAVLLRCFNNTGSTINKGQLVYLPGGNSGDQPYIDLADSSDIAKMPAFGVAKENIAPSASGEIVTIGVLTGLNLTGFTTGDTLYVNGVGAFQNTAPTGEADFIQSVGKVIKGGTGGAIEFTGAGRTNATPNLDDGNIFIGNATNQATTANLYGEINTHLAAFGSNTITTTGNVETGNLTATTSLFVDGVSGNVLIQPNVALDGKTYSSIVRGEFDTGTANSTTSQAFVIDNYTTQGVTNFESFANTAAGNLAGGASFGFNNYAAIGNANTDPLVASLVAFTAYPDSANLANSSTQTRTSMTMGSQGVDGFLTVIGTGANDDAGTGAWRQFQYRPKAMEFVRRAGNADNRQSPVANDETSLNFFTTQTLSGNPGTVYQYPAKIGSKVDPGWTDPNNPAKATPSGLFFKVLSEDSANLEHRMYGNGTTTFNVASDSFGTPIATNPVSIGLDGTVTANAFTATTGNITATAGQFVGDGGGLSNIASANVTGLGNIATINIDGDAANILYGNGVFAPAGAAGIQSQIANGTSNVDIATSGGNVDITVSGNTSVIATDIGAIVQNEPLGNITISPGGAFGAGYVSNQYEPVSLKFFRRDGNSTNKVSPSANAETSFDFYTTQTNGGVPGSVYNYAAKMGSKVDPGWTDPNDPFKATPSGLFYKVVSEDSSNLEHRMYANGTTTFNAFSQDFTGTPISTNPVSIGLNGTVTANAFTATTGVFTGDGGGLSNVSATASPAGFADSVQYNDGGTALGGDSVFTYNSSGKTLALTGTGGAPGPQSIANFNIRNGAFTVTQEEVGGGVATFNFKNFYAGTLIAPSTYFRARGTESAQTGVVAGDEILNEGYKVNAGGTGPTFLGVGSVTATVAANDGAGNVSMKYTIDTKQGSVFENDSVLLNTHLTDVSGNVRMTGNNETILTATRFRGQTDTFANLPSVGVTAGERAMITDLNVAFSFGSIVTTGGGTTTCPVYYDGANWRQG